MRHSSYFLVFGWSCWKTGLWVTEVVVLEAAAAARLRLWCPDISVLDVQRHV